jgi:hypothetical protein
VSVQEAHFLGGFIAGEGCFSVVRRPETFAKGEPRLRFLFDVEVASRDRNLLERLRLLLGAGAIRDRQRRPDHQPASALRISSAATHRRSTIPFAERHVPPSAKRVQFERWRDTLVAYERDRPTQWGRGPSTCSIDGCDHPVRGRGLCRRHYYRATGY